MRPSGPPDRAAAERAVADLLEALGFDPADEPLKETPTRVASAFIETITAGYRSTAEEAIGSGFVSQNTGPVIATRVPLIFTCPHHLMIAKGFAHLAFLPGPRVPGLSRLFRLVDVLSHRLVLQEDLTFDLAQALKTAAGAVAGVVLVDAEHGCIAVEDMARKDTSIRTRATFGAKRDVESLDREIDVTIGRPWTISAAGPISRGRGSKSPSRSRRRPVDAPKKHTSSR